MHVRYTGLEEVTPTVNRSSALGMDGPINPPTGNPGTIPRPPRSNAQPRSTMRLTEGATQSPPLKAKAPVGAARVRDIQLEMPYRAVFVVVENWPSGTMAIKFGRAMKDALMVTDDRIQLVQMSPERIFRAVTNVTEQDFRASLSASGVSVPEKIGFVEL